MTRTPVDDAKAALRTRVLDRRRDLSALELAETARDLGRVIDDYLAAIGARVVAAYVSVGREPGTGPLLDRLEERGVEVLLPLLLPDGDLDWARWGGPQGLRPATRGLLEPVTRPLGVDAVRRADAVLVPGLAVDRRGTRLGRGGGSYDRALPRVRPGVPVAIVVHQGEVLDIPLPRATHDVPVTVAITRAGARALG